MHASRPSLVRPSVKGARNDYVAAGKELINLEAIDPIKVDLQMPERHAGTIRAGQAITVRGCLPRPGVHGARLCRGPGARSRDEKRQTARASPEPQPRVVARHVRRASLVISERADALWVPQQSLVPLGERVYVYRAVGGKAALAEVQVGLRTPGESRSRRA